MIWSDILIEEVIDDEHLCNIFHKLLNIPLDKIQVIYEYDDFLQTDTFDIVCQKSLFQDGFAIMLSIYLFGEISKTPPQVDWFLSKFSTYTNCKCLLPSENNIRSQVWLYEGSKKEIVYIDEEIFESDGIYLIKNP